MPGDFYLVCVETFNFDYFTFKSFELYDPFPEISGWYQKYAEAKDTLIERKLRELEGVVSPL